MSASLPPLSLHTPPHDLYSPLDLLYMCLYRPALAQRLPLRPVSDPLFSCPSLGCPLPSELVAPQRRLQPVCTGRFSRFFFRLIVLRVFVLYTFSGRWHLIATADGHGFHFGNIWNSTKEFSFRHSKFIWGISLHVQLAIFGTVQDFSFWKSKEKWWSPRNIIITCGQTRFPVLALSLRVLLFYIFAKKKHFFRLVVVGFQFRFVGYVYFTCIDSNIWINADIRTPWSYIYFMYSFGRRHIRICKFSLGQGAYLQVIARLPSTTVRR